MSEIPGLGSRIAVFCTVRYRIIIHEGPLFSMGGLDIQGLEETTTERLRAGDTMLASDIAGSISDGAVQFVVAPGTQSIVRCSPTIPVPVASARTQRSVIAANDVTNHVLSARGYPPAHSRSWPLGRPW